MGRLADIIERNQHANRRSRERVYVSLFFGCAILLIIGLMVFTDLGTPPIPKRAPTPAATAVPGVLLRKAPARPAATGSASP